MSAMNIILPGRLKPGDTIYVVCPSSPVDSERVWRGVATLSAMGFRVKVGTILKRLYGQAMVSAPDEVRIKELEDAFLDKEAKCVMAARGGYGTIRLLGALDYSIFRENPRVLVGYSDLTALLNAIHMRTGLVTFHGPMVATDFGSNQQSNYTIEWFRKATMSDDPIGRVEQPNGQMKCVVEGLGRGQIVGGNLTLLTRMLGTPFEPDFEGKIVLLEDVAEEPYKVDGMLTQLLLNGSITRAAGIVFSSCVDCPPPDQAGKPINAIRVEEVVRERLEKIGVPSVYGFNAGHNPHIPTVPIGVTGELDATNRAFSIVERCTAS